MLAASSSGTRSSSSVIVTGSSAGRPCSRQVPGSKLTAPSVRSQLKNPASTADTRGREADHTTASRRSSRPAGPACSGTASPPQTTPACGRSVSSGSGSSVSSLTGGPLACCGTN